MKIKTAWNHYARMKTRVADYVNPSYSHEQSLKSIVDYIYKSPEWKRVPDWVRQRIMEYFHARVDAAHAFGALKWCHEWEGVRYHGWDELPEAGREAGRNNALVSYHYWVKTGVRFN